jgi:hypothetical protein
VPAWVRSSRCGLSSEEAELDGGEGDDTGHEDDGLRRGAAEVEVYDAVAMNFDDESIGCGGGAALGERPDGAESVEGGVGEFDDDQEEGCGREQREGDGAKAVRAFGSVDTGGLYD